MNVRHVALVYCATSAKTDAFKSACCHLQLSGDSWWVSLPLRARILVMHDVLTGVLHYGREAASPIAHNTGYWDQLLMSYSDTPRVGKVGSILCAGIQLCVLRVLHLNCQVTLAQLTPVLLGNCWVSDGPLVHHTT
jgi:hypothetical protein